MKQEGSSVKDQIETLLDTVGGDKKAVFVVGLHKAGVSILLKGDGAVLTAVVTPEQAIEISMRFFQLAVEAKAAEIEESL